MIDIDITMPIQILNILFLIVIMNVVLYRPVRGILEERRKKLADLADDAANFKKNAQRQLDNFDRKMQDARATAKAKFDEARGEAQSAGAEELAKVRKEADGAKAEQMAQVSSQFDAARQQLQGQIAGFADEMASKILGRAL
ncbi:MAG: ATP synthase F0 subunit B [Desulfobulbaceae bacterium]|nr:ATP synthase F0 subunit B [Desulfobulbaceae bacterium]